MRIAEKRLLILLDLRSITLVKSPDFLVFRADSYIYQIFLSSETSLQILHH